MIPDVLVTCESRERGRLYVTTPKLVVEVISGCSVTNDLVRKPAIYDAVDSIGEYLVVDSRLIWARVFRRDGNGVLSPAGEDLASAQSSVILETVGLTFTLEDLYRGVV